MKIRPRAEEKISSIGMSISVGGGGRRTSELSIDVVEGCIVAGSETAWSGNWWRGGGGGGVEEMQEVDAEKVKWICVNY